MSDKNPYQTPGAELERAASSGDLHSPNGVSIGRGVSWFTEGFPFFSASALSWIVIFILLVVIVLVFSFIPVANLLLSFIMPVFMGGLMMGCRSIDTNEGLQISHLFAGFSRAGKLFGVGLAYFAGNILALLLAVLVVGMTGGEGTQEFVKMFVGQEPDPSVFGSDAALQEFFLFFLVYMAMLIPVMMATWFAPVLVSLHEIGVIQALKMSFSGCIKNILPFLLYGIVLMIAVIIGMIPLFLGLLVVIPVLYASIYVSYKDIFIN